MEVDELETAETPEVPDSAWVAPSANVVGDVTLGEGASVWYNCVLRGDIAPIRIGADVNVQDLTMVHVDRGLPAVVGPRVGIGHRAVIHGCEVEADCLVGMGATILSGATVGRGSVIAAHALVTEGAEVPSGSLVVGTPGEVVREVDDELRERIRLTVEHYSALKEGHRHGRWRPAGGEEGGSVPPEGRRGGGG